MTPGRYDLPTIWRGRDYPPIIMIWKNQLGLPIDLTDYQPDARTQDFDLNAEVLDAVHGITAISLPNSATSPLKLGVRNWDWVWLHVPSGYKWPPFLMGKVEVKQTLATNAVALPPASRTAPALPVSTNGHNP